MPAGRPPSNIPADVKQRIADAIKTHRENHGWSRQVLATKLGVSLPAIYAYETGRAMPKRDKVLSLSRCFRIPMSTFTASA